MSSKVFRARYHVYDGYVGRTRPRYFDINAEHLSDNMTEDDLVRFYENAVQFNFIENVGPLPERIEDFIAWARTILNNG